MANDPFDLLNPLSPASPANPLSPTNPASPVYRFDSDTHEVRVFDSNVCSCLSPEFCRDLDQAGNNSGVPEDVDIPEDANRLKALLEGRGISLQKFAQCTGLEEELLPSEQKTLEERRRENATAGAVFGGGAGIIIGLVLMVEFGWPLLAVAVLGLAGAAIFGAMGYFGTTEEDIEAS